MKNKTLCQDDHQKLINICLIWDIQELAIFGSILNDRFSPESDVDCLVEFSDEADWDLFEIVNLKRQLSELFEREVDLVEKSSIVNSFYSSIHHGKS